MTIIITKDNLKTWDGIIYTWILKGLMEDNRIPKTHYDNGVISKYGRCMGISNRLTKSIIKQLKIELKNKKELRIG